MPVRDFVQNLLEGLTQLNPQAAAQLAQRKSAAETLKARLFEQNRETGADARSDAYLKNAQDSEARLRQIDQENRTRQAGQDERQAQNDQLGQQQRQYENRRQTNADITSGLAQPVAPALTMPSGQVDPTLSQNVLGVQPGNFKGSTITAPSPDELNNPEVYGVPGMGDLRLRPSTPEEHATQQANIASQTAQTQYNTQKQIGHSKINDLIKENPDLNPRMVSNARMQLEYGIKPDDPTETKAVGQAIEDLRDPDPGKRKAAENQLSTYYRLQALAHPKAEGDPEAVDYHLKASMLNPDYFTGLSGKTKDAVGQAWVKESANPQSPIYGVPPPGKVEASIKNKADVADLTLQHVHNVLDAINDPDVQNRIGVVWGRQGNAEIKIGNMVGMTDEQKQKVAKASTSIQYLFARELQGILGSRPGQKLAEMMKENSPRMSEEMPLLMGQLDGVAQSAGATKDTVERARFGGKTRQTWDSGYHPQDFAPKTIPIVKTKDDYDKLSSGTVFVDSQDGKHYKKK